MHNPHQHQTEPFVIRQLNMSGRVMMVPVPKAARASYAFFYLCEGEVLTEAGEESYLLGKNMFLLLPPNVPYSVKWYDNAVAFMGGFEESFLLDPSYEILRSHHPVLCHVKKNDVSLFEAAITKLFSEQSKAHIVQYTFDYILKLLSEHLSLSEAENEKLAVVFVDEVFNRSHELKTITEYAKALGVTPNHLNKVVKARTGRTASEWVQISRINYAKYLLRDNSLSIVDVAERVGIFDQSYFSRFFKKHVGQSPSEYRSRFCD